MPLLLRHVLLFALRVLAGLALASLAYSARAEPPGAIGLVIIDPGRAHPTRDAWQRAFLAHLNAELAKSGLGPVRLADPAASARTAAGQLRDGRCDAALFIGDERPYALRRLAGPTLAATLSPMEGRRSIFLVLGEAHPALHGPLRTSFEAALADENFQAVVQGRTAAAVPAFAATSR